MGRAHRLHSIADFGVVVDDEDVKHVFHAATLDANCAVVRSF